MCLSLCSSTAPTSPPLNTTGRAVNSTAILFTWEHPLVSGRNGNITGYSLLLTELETNITTSYRQTGARIELVVGSLHPFYQYQCVIAAETRVGRGPYADSFITRTLADGMYNYTHYSYGNREGSLIVGPVHVTCVP